MIMIREADMSFDRDALERLAPIPERHRAALISNASDGGPTCCIGECCGPGSYCCGHPDNEHTHDEGDGL